LRGLGVGGILGGDMGVGKTLQTLAHLLLEKQAGRLDRPALVVMPTSLIPNWQDEAARFTPELRVLTLHGPSRQKHFAEIAGYDLLDRKSTRLNSSHVKISYAVFCLKKKKGRLPEYNKTTTFT